MIHTKKPNKAEVKRRVRALFHRAKQHERSNAFEPAKQLLRQCVDIDRTDAHSWLALARLVARTAHVPEPGVDESAETERTSDTKNERRKAKNAMQASALFEQAVTECPNNVHLLQAWAVHENRHGNRRRARELFSSGLKLDPSNAYVCQAWGRLEQQEGNNDKARELYSCIVSQRPHPEVCAAWASLETRDGNIEKARGLYKQGLSACKNVRNAGAASSSGMIYKAWAGMEEIVGDLPRARSLLSKAITAHPTDGGIYVALGKLEARRGGTARALELMRTAASLDNPPASVFNHWAQIEWQMCSRPDEARKLLQRGIKLHPKDPALLQTLGTLEDKFGNTEEAKQFFLESVRSRPTAPALVAWALLEERDGNYDKCKTLFEEALEANPLHGAAYNAYGMMEARRGSLIAARGVFERGLEVNATASVWHGYGQLELKIASHPDRARQLFRQGTARTSEDTSFIWHSWGMLELSQKMIHAARDVFSKALKRYPRNSRLLVGRAMAEGASCPNIHSNEQDAREYFRRAIGADPTHAHAWQVWGVFELRKGRFDAAEALFRRGLRLCPSHGALWQAWGVLETSRGNFARARRLYSKGILACPANVYLFQAWACMEVQSGNVDKARELLDHALESDSSHGPVWNAYGLLEAKYGSLARARQSFVTGIRRAPHHAPLYRTYGQLEARTGNYDRARRIFENGLKVDPRHAPLYHALAQLEAVIGNLDALAELKAKAEQYFGSEAEAMNAMRSGEENANPEVDPTEDGYEARATSMEIALNNQDDRPRRSSESR